MDHPSESPPDNWDEWEEEENQPTKDLFSSEMFKTPAECVKFMRERYDFDLLKLKKECALDTYDLLKLVNFIRTSASPALSTSKFSAFVSENENSWKDDKYLMSALPDDPLLFYAGDDGDSWSDKDDSQDEEDNTFKEISQEALSKLSPAELVKRVSSLIKENKHLKEKFLFQDNSEKTPASIQANKKKEVKKPKSKESSQPKVEPKPASVVIPVAGPSVTRTDVDDDEEEDGAVAAEDADYFGTYEHYQIHNDMLKDKVRTLSYMNFIYQNSHIFKDKVVMDIGCGSGILSMFAVKAGAKKVVAVDSAGIITHAQENAKQNSMEDKITFVRSKVELIDNLMEKAGVEKVDVIISEWMGYCLLYECMLPSVLIARDRFCTPKTGLVFPDIAEMFIAGWSSNQYLDQKITFWNDVYGFKMDSIKKKILRDPHVDTLGPNDLLTEPSSLKAFDINAVGLNDLDFSAPFTLNIQGDSDGQKKNLHGFVVYFDIHFKKECTSPVFFSTGPKAEPTHWHQTIFILPETVEVVPGDKVEGFFECKRRQHHRDLLLHVKWRIPGKVDTWTEMPFMLL